MSRLCPQCQIPLQSLEFQNTTLDECVQCGGIWFDDGELKRCQGADSFSRLEMEGVAHPAVQAVEMNAHGRMCPTCNRRLTSYQYLYSSDIELDECDCCYGVWVQDGELQKMAEFLEAERSEEVDPALLKAQTRAEAAGLVAILEQQTAESKIRTGRIVTLWRSLSRRTTPFAQWKA